MKTENAIIVKNLTKFFKKTLVLKGVDLEVKRGTILTLLGPNGAGKTTTIRILSTLLQPDGGEVVVNGFNVIKEPQKVRESIGLTGQFAAVDEYLTGIENLLMMGRLCRLNYSDTKRRANELTRQFDLVEAQSRKVKTYSGGMRRRLDLALSLMSTPPVLFLDEPTTGLDPRSRLMMWDMIQKLAAENVTILLTTQNMEEADRLSNQIAILDQGKIIAQGTAQELKALIGEDRLKLTIKNSQEFTKALDLVKREGMQIDEKQKLIDIPVDVKEVHIILSHLEDSQIELESLSLQKPNLDDVFLNLTGHKAETEEEK